MTTRPMPSLRRLAASLSALLVASSCAPAVQAGGTLRQATVEEIYAFSLNAMFGKACSGSGDCGSGFCVDGVCCNAACGLACQGCVATKTGMPNGTCAGRSDSQANMLCGAVCADLTSDKNNCGGCGKVCTGSCVAGKCYGVWDQSSWDAVLWGP